MRIRRLDPLVAQRIAAGEVIERPASVVRELVDNALDANSSSITVSVEEGGIRKITVIDDGAGIAKEDLPLLCESHATSKVRELDDLYTITSMGFRGEALYSIAAVGAITIQSSYQGQDPFQITVDNGIKGEVLPGGPERGTTVIVEDLFGQLPARRQFLKRTSTEATMARQVLTQKAIAYPERSFRFYQDGKLRIDLPATDAKQRVIDVLQINQPVSETQMVELRSKSERFSLYAVTSTATLFRSDRSQIRIYINSRPVDEYAFVQAINYGYGDRLPGGSFPYTYLFIEIDPTLVDFNIHPTKREVKIRNQAEVHHQIVQLIRANLPHEIPSVTLPPASEVDQGEFFHSSRPASATSSAGTYTPKSERRPIDPKWFDRARELLQEAPTEDTEGAAPAPYIAEGAEAAPAFTYIGQAFNLFLLVERGDDLYLVDQHAAHERLIYDEVRAKNPSQPLLVPIEFEVSADVDAYLADHLDRYRNLGIKVVRKEALLWQLEAIPGLYKAVESQVVEFIQKNTGDSIEVEKGLYAIVACHASIRKGDRIDRPIAIELLEKVFALDEPVCPHGRTFVVRLRKAELSEAVGRTN
ncbi:MAG TPA: DNA mismatch repair endonuclease MutL [Sphaerochaeta sp.]|nr:DNA mismatch repair endonuclease MutL [Sphaerochaeta sp.]